MNRQDLPKDSLKLHQTALCLLGEYPRRFFVLNIIHIATRLRYYFKHKSDEEILCLPTLTDGPKRAAMRFLIRATASAENVGKIQDFLLCILRGVHYKVLSLSLFE